MIRAAAALYNRVAVLSPHRLTSSRRPGCLETEGMLVKRKDRQPGMRCNLRQVLFDYGTGMVTTLLRMSVGITWHGSWVLTKLLYLNHTCCKYNNDLILACSEFLRVSLLPALFFFIARFRLVYSLSGLIVRVFIKCSELESRHPGTKIPSQWFVLEKDHRMATDLLFARGQHNTPY